MSRTFFGRAAASGIGPPPAPGAGPHGIELKPHHTTVTAREWPQTCIFATRVQAIAGRRAATGGIETMLPITEHIVKTARQTTFYLACGAEDAPLIVFVHGWPELSVSWRHQLPCLAALGFRAVAPDMRGYGRSGVYPRHEAYALEEIVKDMLELLDALGQDRAVWVGHDWGSPVVWSLASHHPERCHAVASLCVPYLADGFTPTALVPLVDRSVYPEAEFPVGQWDYQLFYLESFDRARQTFEANPRNTLKALFRKGNPKGKGQPSR